MVITFFDVVVFLLVFLAVFYYYGMRPYKYYENTDVKFVKPLYPILGSLDKIIFQQMHLNDYIELMYWKYPDEKYVGLFEGSKPLIMLRDLEIIKQIGIKDIDNFHDHRTSVNVDNDLFCDVLFNMKGDKWREMRAALSPAFTSSKMKYMFSFIDECAEEFSEYFVDSCSTKENGVVEIELSDTITRYANDVIATAVFGLKVNSLKDKENFFYSHGKVATDFTGTQLFKMIGFILFPKIMKALKIKFTRPSVNNFFTKIVTESIKNREETGLIRQDMIHLLMLAKKGSLVHENDDDNTTETGFATVEESSIGKQQVKRKWTESELVAQALLFFIGGFSTTSAMILFFFYEMIRNPDIQKKIHEEIDDFIAKSDGKLNYYDVQKLKYLDMTLSETLRMWPPLAQLDRVCHKPYTLPPPNENSQKTYEIKKNELVWIPLYSLLHDPKYFPNPNKFDPERFSDENKHTIDPTAYIPFGIGPRNCIGSRFALLEIKLFLFHIFSKFEVVPTEKTEIPMKLKKGMAMLLPLNGFWAGLKKRKST